MSKIKYFLRDDIYSELIFGVLVLTGPFMTVVMNGNSIVWYLSLGVAICALASVSFSLKV